MVISLYILIIAFLFGTHAGKDKTTNCSVAVATFDGTRGVYGTVTIDEVGQVTVDLDAAYLNASICDDDGAELAYHVHETWAYDDFTPRFEGDCGSTYTGGTKNVVYLMFLSLFL